MITVVIPAFNRPDLLKRAIKSVEQQTIKATLIVVDDGSHDSLESATSGWGFPVKVLRNSIRLGAQKSRLKGVLAATTPLVALLDSDDWWAENKLQQQLATWRNNKDSLLCTRMFAIADGQRKLVPDVLMNASEKVEDYLYVRGGMLQTSTFFAAKHIMANVLQETAETTVHNDTAMAIAAREKGYSIVQLGEPLSYFDDNNRADRISLDRSKLDASLSWFGEVSSRWSEASRSGFMIKDTAMRQLQCGERKRAFVTVLLNLRRETAKQAVRTLLFIICNGSPKRLLHRLRP